MRRLLNLPPHGLVAIADALYRAVEGRPGRSYLDRAVDGDMPGLRERTEQLIDQARGSDRMTGGDWDELTCNLCAMPSVFLYPSTLWNDLVDRLLAEMIIADGLGWLQRSEALHRLLGHPVGEPVVVAACAALVADPGNKVFVDPLTQLESSPHRFPCMAYHPSQVDSSPDFRAWSAITVAHHLSDRGVVVDIDTGNNKP
jgi:hypothetical protein